MGSGIASRFLLASIGSLKIGAGTECRRGASCHFGPRTLPWLLVFFINGRLHHAARGRDLRVAARGARQQSTVPVIGWLAAEAREPEELGFQVDTTVKAITELAPLLRG